MTAADDTREALIDLLRRHGLDSLGAVLSLSAGQDLDKPGLRTRRRTRLELADGAGRTHVVYLKRYGRDSLRARLRRRWEARCWCSAGQAEFENVRAASDAGLTAMREIAWGAEPRGGRSFAILSEAPGEALERCDPAFWDRMTRDEAAGAALAAALAGLVRRLHGAGWVHRDLYASHVFVQEQEGLVELGLIDLARMFRPRWRFPRWRVKDLASLHSSLPPAWVSRWWDVLLGQYLGQSSPAILEHWRRAVERKSCRISRHAHRAAGPDGPGCVVPQNQEGVRL
jgi:hypothetical protein